MTIGLFMETTNLARLEEGVENETLHLRAMRKEDQGITFYQKTPNLCKMHKNRQNSVDSISDICLDVGMDARTMKKHILHYALEQLSLGMSAVPLPGSAHLAIISDIDNMDITQAQLNRYNNVLQSMIESAESKLD